MMTSAQVVETSVTVTDNSPFQDYPHPDDHSTRSTLERLKTNEPVWRDKTPTFCGIFLRQQSTQGYFDFAWVGVIPESVSKT